MIFIKSNKQIIDDFYPQLLTQKMWQKQLKRHYFTLPFYMFFFKKLTNNKSTMPQQFQRLLEDSIDQLPAYQINHINMMPYLWTVVINISIFFALCKFNKFTIYIHAIIALFISITTLLTALPILIDQGIPKKQNDQYEQRHFIIGVIIIILILLQLTLGIIAKILQMIRWSHPYLVFIMNVVHKYLGYSLITLCKIQVFLILGLSEDETSLFWGLIASQIVFICLWILSVALYPKMEENIMPKYSLKSIRNIDSLLCIKKKQIGVFANYVYNLQPLILNHPCGFRIIESIKGKELDRFIYGMYSSQKFPSIPPNSHGFKSLNLLNDSIAKITIPSVYQGLQNQITDVLLNSVKQVSQKSSIYQLKISKKYGIFSYQGYQSLNQIGRYYSLTIDGKITRLYIAVGFLDSLNMPFLKKQLDYFVFLNSLPHKAPLTEQSMLTIRQLGPREQNGDITLLVKLYQTGAFTPKLIGKQFKSLKLSQPRGEGLRLQEIQSGKIIIVAGGTGLYPFCDLIDLLAKCSAAQMDPTKQAQIYKKDPMLSSKPFLNLKFHLLLSVDNLSDIHPITLLQILQLNKKWKKFKLTLRITKQYQQYKQILRQITFTNQRFDTLLLKEMNIEPYEKAFICGPPVMTTAIVKQLDKHKINKGKYLVL